MAGHGRHILGHSWVPFFIFTWCSHVKMSRSSQTKLFMSGSGSINKDKLRCDYNDMPCYALVF